MAGSNIHKGIKNKVITHGIWLNSILGQCSDCPSELNDCPGMGRSERQFLPVIQFLSFVQSKVFLGQSSTSFPEGLFHNLCNAPG